VAQTLRSRGSHPSLSDSISSRGRERRANLPYPEASHATIEACYIVAVAIMKSKIAVMGLAPPIFTARRIPKDPLCERCSGIEDGELFYPSLHFRTRHGAAKDAAARRSRPTRGLRSNCGSSSCAAASQFAADRNPPPREAAPAACPASEACET
jgi:hypothetical protein